MRSAITAAVILVTVVSTTAQTRQPPNATITAVPGIKVGHFTLSERPTGCTVILVDGDAVGGVAQHGGAPATRETDSLHPLNTVERVHGVVLTGGSAFGLEVATGVVRWLEEQNVGFPTAAGKVPIVPAAAIFDLPVGSSPKIRPTADCGYRAAQGATTQPVTEGSVGAGAGATAGKLAGFLAQTGQAAGNLRPTKAGVGSSAIRLPNGLIVGAIVVVNAIGDIIDPSTGRVVAGMRNADGTFADARKILRAGGPLGAVRPGEHTTIGVVATNASLTKAQVNRMALMADDAHARAINPAHTMGDGDTVFALATGRWTGAADLTIVGALAAESLADAVVRAATQATGAAGIPAARELRR